MPEIKPQDSSPLRRRNFLKTSALLAAPALLWAQPEAAYANEGRGKRTRQLFASIQQHENDHVAFLELALGELARPKPVFQGLMQRKYEDFLVISQALENTGVGAYLFAAPALMDRGLLAAAGSIATVEARHAGVLNFLQEHPVTNENESFETPLSPDDVLAAAGAFVKDLNGGPPLSFSAEQRSDENDIAILNYALALEYLEAEFYNVNVPRFFK